MSENVVLLSIPGLRDQDLASMQYLSELIAGGDRTSIVPSFPCVTACVQANMTTGELPTVHGVIGDHIKSRANAGPVTGDGQGYDLQAPRIWDTLKKHRPELTSAVWFAANSEQCSADFVCTEASARELTAEAATRPAGLYEELRTRLGPFPASPSFGADHEIMVLSWIAESAIQAAERFRPNFFYICFPHVACAAQRSGPDSEEAQRVLEKFDQMLGEMFRRFRQIFGQPEPLYIAASEFTIIPVDYVLYPNDILRRAGLLSLREVQGTEVIDYAGSQAFAIADHQCSHIYVRNASAPLLEQVRKLFEHHRGIAQVLSGAARERYGLAHERAGDVILVSTANSWQASQWRLESSAAINAQHVQPSSKLGCDPVGLFLQEGAARGSTAPLIRGSHGAPAIEENQRGPIVTSMPGVLEGPPIADTDVYELVLRQFGV